MADIIGTDQAETLTGTGDADSIAAGDGNDLIRIGDAFGNDTIDGGGGADTLDAGTQTIDSDVVFSAPGTGTLTQGSDNAAFTGIERLVLGAGNDSVTGAGTDAGFDVNAGDGNDTIIGSDARDTIDGGAGNDFIDAGGTNDLIESSAGDDTVYGGGGDDGIRWGGRFDEYDHQAGHDVIHGGETGETSGDALNILSTGGANVVMTGAEAGHASDTGGNTVIFDEIERVLTGVGNDTIDASGAALADSTGVNIRTQSGNDTIIGSSGNDTLDAGYDADVVNPGAGDDVITLNGNLYGDPGQPDTQTDTLVLQDGSGADRVLDFDGPRQLSDGSYVSTDRLDVSGLHDANGDPVRLDDVTVSDDGNGNAVLTFPNGESLTLIGISPDRLRDPGALLSMGVPCFTAGTLVETSEGPVAVQDLTPGSLVVTRDHGMQPVRWIGRRRLSSVDLAVAPHLRPIRIAAGALGPGTPHADLLVSPQHRLLIRSRIAQRMFGTSEILVAAKQLLSLPGVSVDDVASVEYVHILFDRHEIIVANGAETESLYTGAEALDAVGPAARTEIFELFPELSYGVPALPARPLAAGRKARRLADRHARNMQPLVGPH